ncbi:hypothetical protein PDE_02530 [Penicillium oxalicum 114-2]|uniref:Uncharacterized protein n=1 Tax=Penicillium oxalicum (strain 114-2 / CGMCC 5302) TaxID=933388 RepID=S8AZX6_PENO1|nr:hypothetical protein PDE_02530 [Penicillium oxalicum 114-2]
MHPSFILSNIIHKYHVFAKPGSATSVTVQQKVTLRKKKNGMALVPSSPHASFNLQTQRSSEIVLPATQDNQTL